MKREAFLYQVVSLEELQVGDHHRPTTSQQRSSVDTCVTLTLAGMKLLNN